MIPPPPVVDATPPVAGNYWPTPGGEKWILGLVGDALKDALQDEGATDERKDDESHQDLDEILRRGRTLHETPRPAKVIGSWRSSREAPASLRVCSEFSSPIFRTCVSRPPARAQRPEGEGACSRRVSGPTR
jgi:hypothetical protein